MDVGALDPQGIRVPEVLPDVPLGQDRPDLPLLRRPVDDLVVDVGEVPDVGDPETPVVQISADHVEDHEGAGVAQVDEVIDCRATDVHPDLCGCFGTNRSFFRVKVL